MSLLSHQHVLSRRAFGATVGATALSLFAPGSCGSMPPAARAASGPLVCLFLRGAADGLSLVVPHADEDYRRARPRTAIAAPGQRAGAIALDAQFGLHPGLAPLAALYGSGELAIVHAVGSPHPTRSHFEAQDYMETAVPGRVVEDGWLSRCLDARATAARDGNDLLRALALGQGSPLALRGQRDVVATPRLGSFALRAPAPQRRRLERALASMYAPPSGALAATASNPVLDSGREALAASERLRALALSRYQPSAGVEYPRESAALRDVAAVIKAGVGLEVAWLDVGGWDTHQDQGDAESGRLQRLLVPWAAGLAAFRRDLGSCFADVLVLIATEFGRTLRENGTGGTDHGHGSVMFVLGGRVRGGVVYGKWPGLASSALWEGRDLAVTTDYRDVYAEVCQRHLGISELGAILPGYKPQPALGLLRT